MRAQIEIDLERLAGLLLKAETIRLEGGGLPQAGAFTVHRIRLLLPMEWHAIKDSALKRALERLTASGTLMKGRKGRYSAWWLT